MPKPDFRRGRLNIVDDTSEKIMWGVYQMSLPEAEKLTQLTAEQLRSRIGETLQATADYNTGQFTEITFASAETMGGILKEVDEKSDSFNMAGLAISLSYVMELTGMSLEELQAKVGQQVTLHTRGVEKVTGVTFYSESQA